MDMVGVKFSTLRHYERIGLLNPRKDVSNNFRLYSPLDAFRLNKFRKLRAIGFPSRDAIIILDGLSPDSLDKAFEDQEKNLEQDLIMARARLDKLREMQAHLNEVEENNYQFTKMPPSLFLPASRGHDFSISRYEYFSRWVELLPLTAYCKLLRYQNLPENRETDFGMVITKKNAKLLKERWRKDAELIPGGPCLLFYSRNLGYPEISLDVLKGAEKYITDNGFRVRDIILMEGIDLNSGSSTCHKVTIPIE